VIRSDQIAAACGCSLMRAENWAAPINEAMDAFDITTPARVAAFLAQIGHESGHLQYVRELWGPTPAQARYEGRADLGNTQPGDGYRYRGRGLIQTTGRTNYARTRDGLRHAFDGVPDFEADPEALEAPKWAARSAAWFWSVHGLNVLADQDEFETITRRINGGLNGQAERVALHEAATAAIA
jgi:putative chitinase